MNERKFLPIGKLFPNLITLMGLFCGLTSLKYTFVGKWELSLIFITIAAFLDGMDGRIARLLHSTSNFGAHLDSLADFFNFGVAPALLLYFWHLQTIHVYGWVMVMLFIVCVVLRLARFNTTIGDQTAQDRIKSKFMVGVPAPVGALLSLVPLMLSMNDNPFLVYANFVVDNILYYLLIISMLVISRIPTLSIKKIRVPPNLVSFVMLIFGILMVALLTKPWVTLIIMCIFYIISIPITTFMYFYLQRR